MTGYHIKKVVTEVDEAYCLCDPEGNVVPHQISTSLESEGGCLPQLVVTFVAGSNGLPVIGDDANDRS